MIITAVEVEENGFKIFDKVVKYKLGKMLYIYRISGTTSTIRITLKPDSTTTGMLVV